MRDYETTARGIGYEFTADNDEEAIATTIDLYFNDDMGGKEINENEVEIMWKSEEY